MRLCVACRAPLTTDRWACQQCHWSSGTTDGIPILTRSEDVAEAFSDEQARNLRSVASTHFWFTARNRLIAWALAQYFPGVRTFLEVGCGAGQVLCSLSERFPGLQLTGVEASTEGLRGVAQSLPGVDLAVADATQLPWEQEFDVAGAFDVVEHIAQDGTAVRELARVVKPGGGVLLTVPQHPWLWSPLDDYARHHRRYTRKGLLGLVAASGLEPLFVTSFVSLLLPAMLASRVLQRGAPVDPLQEFRISPAVNRLAGSLMAVERWWIGSRLSIPAGGSLLLVARRR